MVSTISPIQVSSSTVIIPYATVSPHLMFPFSVSVPTRDLLIAEDPYDELVPSCFLHLLFQEILPLQAFFVSFPRIPSGIRPEDEEPPEAACTLGFGPASIIF